MEESNGDREEEEKVERGRGTRKGKTNGQGDGEKAERERTQANRGQRTEDKGEKVAKVKSGATTRYRFGKRSARVYAMLTAALLAQRERKAAERNSRPDALYIETEPHERTARAA